LEFAERNSENKWVVPEANFYPEKFEYDKTYRIKIIASEDRVQQFINNKLVINTDLASNWLSGDIGFQATGSTVQFDNVKVSQFEGELPPLENSVALQPKEPETKIINPPTIISNSLNGDSEAEFSSVHIFVEKNEDNELTVEGTPLSEALNSIKNKKIPIIQMEDSEIEENLINILNETQTTDFHVVSTKPSIVKSFTTAYPTARGGIVYNKTSFNKHDINKLIQDVHASNAKVAIIPQKILSTEVVHALHTRMVSVWGVGGDSEKSAHELIHFGVDGIITDHPGVSAQAFGKYPENTIVQRPIVAAHRGVPSLAPENTMVGYHLAYELGADMIETDVQLTKDNHLVIMHDATVNRTTNGTGRVADLTLEEIQELDAGIKYSEEFAGERVPTFKEFLQAFKGKDVILLVELKDIGIEQQVIEEIEQEGMVNQIVLQSFHLESMVVSNELKPEIPTGYLYSAAVPATETAKIKNAEKMMHYGTNHNATLNASYGSVYKEFTTYMRQRGMLSMHWTFRAEDPFQEKLKQGLIGPITDYMQWLTESPVKLETPQKKINLKTGKSSTVQSKAFVNYRVDKKENIESELFIVDNTGEVVLNGNTIQAISQGKAQVFVKHIFTMLGEEWNLVAEPIEVNVTE
jgi:glycerophosphoryl diester phosphodiesterase